mgnify:CR=1 FL=1
MNRKRTEKLGLPLAAAVVMAMTGLTHAATLYDFEGQAKTDLDNAGWVFGEAAGVDWIVTDDPEDATNDVLRQDNGGIDSGSGTPASAGAFAIAPDVVAGPLQMSVEVRLDSAGSNDDAAVFFGWQDSDNYLFFLLNDNSSNTDIFQVSGGNRSTLVDTNAANVATETWLLFELEHNPGADSLKITLDGIVLYDGTDPEFAVPGQVGVGSFNDAASFDNLEIIPEPATLALLGLGGAVMLAGRKRS